MQGQPKPHRLGRATRAEQQGKVFKKEEQTERGTQIFSLVPTAQISIWLQLHCCLAGQTGPWRSCAEAHLSRGSQEVLGPTAAMELV